VHGGEPTTETGDDRYPIAAGVIDSLPRAAPLHRLHRAATTSRRIASASGLAPNRTGSVAGRPVSAAACDTAARAAGSLMSNVLRQMPITLVGRTGAAARSYISTSSASDGIRTQGSQPW